MTPLRGGVEHGSIAAWKMDPEISFRSVSSVPIIALSSADSSQWVSCSVCRMGTASVTCLSNASELRHPAGRIGVYHTFSS